MKHPVFSRVIALMLFCAFMLQAIPAVSLPALATEGTAMLDRLTLDGGYTLAFDANTLTYEVKLPAGHPRIPQISATADGAVTVTQAAMPVSQNQATGYVKVASKEYSITFVKDPSLGYHLQYGDYYTFVPETEAEIKGFVSSAPDTISVSSAGVLHALALSDSPVTISAIAQDDSVAATMTVDKVVKAPLNLFLITGQSNAYGSYDIPSGMDEASFTAAQMAQTLKPAPGTELCTDVSNKGVILQDMYDLSQGRSGFSPALGKTWYDLTGEKTLMLQTAVGGAPIEAWMKPEGGVRNTYNYTESNFYETTKNAYTHTMQKLQEENSGYELRHTYAYWLQGETGMGNSYNPNKNGAGIGGWDMGSTANILSSQQYYDIFMKNMEYFTGEFGCEFVGILLVRALAGAASAESLELQLLTDLTPTRAAQYALNNRNGKQISIVSRVCDIARMESYSDTSVPGWGYMGCNNLHYNQIGHNANGVEAAKNTYDVMFGRKSAYDLEIIAPNGRDRIEDGQQIVLKAGQSYQTAAMVLPMSAQTKKISYQVADSTVCSVDAFGKITASAEGAGKSTTVTYTCAESGLRKSITVRVESDSASGTLNSSISWTYQSGVLTITGSGATPTYTAATRPFADIADRVTKIIVGEGITDLNGYVLYQMNKAESIQLPSTLKKIQVRALANNTAMKALEIPAGVTVLGAYCFEKSGIQELSFLGTAPTTISGSKPCNGNTYTLHIPCSDTSWTADMLAKLGGTRTVVTEHVGGCPECGDPDAVGGSCGANVTWKLADGVLTLSGSGDTDEFVRTAATDTVNYPWAEHIDAITAIVVEEGITNLDNYCFYNLSKVTSVTLPQSLKRVETRVFSGCTALKELTIPGTLDWAGYEAFAGSGITDLHFKADSPKGCSGTAPCKNMTYNLHIPCNNTAWTGAKIAALGGTATQVLVHNYVGGVCTQCNSQPGGQLGGSCGENVNWTLKDGILTLSGSGDTAEYVRNSDTDTVNYPWADYMNAITAIVVEEGITNLDNYVFYNLKNVTSVTLPNSLERLETRIFKGCTSLQALTVPSTLKYLGLEAFAGSGIKDLYFKANAPEKFSGTKPCANQSMNVHVSCGNASWTADKLSAMGTALSLVLTHKWSGDQCTDCGAAKDMPVASVTLDRASVSLSLAQTVTITAKVMPENATNKTLTWTSSDESVAVVSGGVVTPKGAGTATITATTTDGSGKTASCVVNVSDKLEGSCGQSVSWRIQNGVLTISGTGATTEYVRQSGTNSVNTPWWNVRDLVTSIVVEEGVTVLDNYLFYGLSNAASVRLPKSLTRIETRVFTKCDALTELTVPAAKVYLGYEAFAGSGITDLYFTAGAHGGCSATAPCKDMTYNLHLNCTAQNWTSAQLDAMGGKLSLVIDHSWSNGKCSDCGVKENTPITSITLDKTELSVYCMGTYTVKATITPADATDQVLQWTSSDEAVATVSAVGTVTGVAPGTAVITASAKDGSGVTATCTVAVKDGLGGSCGDHANWTFVDGVLTITGWGSTTKFVRNAQKDTIYYPWADFKDEITKVVVGEGITVLNNYAFYNCKNIRSVRLPGTLKEIAYGAFYGTSSLGSITIPANVSKLGSQAFKGSGLRSVTFLGLSPSSYGKNLFDGVVATVYYLCNDSARSFGNGLTWEKTHTFAEEDGVRKCSKCHELDGTAVTGITLDQTKLLLMSGQSIQLIATVEPANAAYPQVVWSSSEEAVASVSEDGTVTALEAGSAQIIAKAKDGGDVQAVCSVTVRQGVGGQIGDLYWIYHYGKLTITGQGPMPQTNIAPWALYAEEIVELTVEPGVTTIGEKAFAGLEQLAIVHLPETLTQIDAGAFENTRMLKEIEIPASVTALGSRAFADCGLTQIRFLGYLPDAAGDVFTGVTATATILCDDNPKAMGGDITWEQGHDYQPSGEKYVCINCGSETDSISEPAGDQNAAGLGWLWWLLAVAAVAAGAVAVILGRKKQKEK